MVREALYHRQLPSYSFAVAADKICVRFRSAADDVEHVTLWFGGKFDWQQKKSLQMEKAYTDEYFDYYEAVICTDDPRIGYYFEVKAQGEALCYTEAGIRDSFDDSIAYTLFFQYPSVNTGDIPDKPAWFHDAVFYQIFVERFGNGRPEISPPGTAPWDSKPTPKSFFGGDLPGITQHLGYLSELGINALYLTPIFKSVSNHKYDTIDYMEIDGHFGTKEDFRELVDKAHALGIRIVLDAVFNHCSDEFAPFRDVMENGERSEYKDWFLIKSLPLNTNPPSYETFGMVAHMPRFNTDSEGLRDYLLSVASYWTREFNIDGWRLDVADEPSHGFWREFRRTVKAINSEAVLIGEVWHDASVWLMGDQFDTVMNYPVTNLCVEFFCRRTIDARSFCRKLSGRLADYSGVINHMMFNLLDSHDTERFLYSCGGRVQSLKCAAAFLMSFVGTPCTYYGTEVGMTGGYDPGCRRGFPWDKLSWNLELYDYYKKLIAIRKSEKALKYGGIRFMPTESLYVSRRSFGDECILIVINNTPEEQKLPPLLLEGLSSELIGGGGVTDIIPAMSAMYFK